MSINNEIYNKALNIINTRRLNARIQNDAHFEEINLKIPEIAEINRQLAKTGFEIVNIIKNGENVESKIKEMREKNIQAQQIIKDLLKRNGFPEDYLAIKYRCEKCADTGFINNKKCSCLENVVSMLAAEKMNLSSNISLCSFDTFQLNLIQGKAMEETKNFRSIMNNIYLFCKKYADGFSYNSSSILMFGKTGLGKTHLSLSIANEVIKKGFNVLYDSTLNYLLQIEKEHFGRDNSGNDTLNLLLSADLLILDDLGSEFDTSFYNSTIYNIINTRLNRNLPTIISTNLNHEKIQNKYDDRIVSRLFALYTCLEFVGTDIRLIKAKIQR